ncbi:MAG: hypothetical protein V3V41_09425 [Candidatus Heimdallarchaeota archaeon]
MLICLFKLEDIGPVLADMILDQNVVIDETTIEKFSFSGSITYSLIFQGMLHLEDMTSELYGPFPFAFSSGFVQYAFSFIAEDKTVKDKRMKKNTLGLVLMLVPEIVSKIDDFREELAKILIYKFHSIYKINQVNKEFLSDIIQSYNKILTDLLSSQQAVMLSKQIIDFLAVKPVPSAKKELENLAVIYPEKYTTLIKNYYASFLSSLPYQETSFDDIKAIIKTKNYAFHFRREDQVEEDFINTQKAIIFLVDISNRKYKTTYTVLSKLEEKPKIALVVSLPEDIEKASHQYAKFFTGLEGYISGMPFFSASFTSTSEFKAKMLEALFWTLSPA